MARLDLNIGRLGRSGPRPDLICDQLPYAFHLSDDIVALDSQALMMSFSLQGVGFEACEAEVIEGRVAQLNSAWRNLAQERLAVWHHVLRRPAQAPARGAPRSAFGAQLDEAYRRRLDALQLFETQLYLTLVIRPADAAGAGLGGAASATADLEAPARKLRTAGQELCALLERYGPRPLKLYTRGGLIFSEPMELVARLLSGAETPVPLVRGRLAGGAPGLRLIFGRESLEIRDAAASTYGAMFSLKEYPARTPPGLWDSLLALPFPLTLTQSFAFLSKPAALAILTRKQNQMVSARDPAASQTAALSQAADDLASNRFAMGEHHASVLVYADSPAALADRMARMRALLAESGLVAARDDLGLVASFWAQFPGVFGQRLRPAPITSDNFSALAPFHTHPRGAERGHWGAPITTLRTGAGSPYRFHLHVEDVGHTFICGPTGSGKTVVQNFLLSQLEGAEAQAILIDKDRGGEIFVRASEGVYLTFDPGEPTGLAPLKRLEPTAANQAFLTDLIATLVRSPDAPLASAAERRIAAAVAAMAALPAEQRSFAALRTLLGPAQNDGLAARLAPWCAGEPLGWVFDNAEDVLSLSPSLMGIDVTHFLDAPKIRAPLMMYLLHRISAQVDGRRLVVDIDEFWKALGDEAFRGFAQDGLKTYRKQNACLVLATQSPADVLKSDIAHTLLEQCATKIYLPNPQASLTDYVDGFGLSRREYDLVRAELSAGKRQFLIKQGAHAVVAELRLDGLKLELAVLSGRAESLAILDPLRRTLGDHPQQWLPAFNEWSQSQ